ncbi:MAG: ribbon-helix-helix protein, CopG family, partial [Synergistaceae bacterium]|nr:ribbon-helix-helix protein, CopG family [Synergistaceae bacterium]
MSELEEKQENNNKNNLTRFSITMPQDLLDEFDALIEREERPNRSDALRGLVRSYITQSRWQSNNNINNVVCGTVTLI